MASIFMLRHQAGGFLTEFCFAQQPTKQQIAAAQALCTQRHGDKHPKSEKPYWLNVVEIPILTPNDDIAVVVAPKGKATGKENTSAIPPMTMEGTGRVWPPKP